MKLGVIYHVEYDGLNTVSTCSRDGYARLFDLRVPWLSSGEPSAACVLEIASDATSAGRLKPIYNISMEGYRLTLFEKDNTMRFFDLRRGRHCVQRLSAEDLGVEPDDTIQLCIDDTKCALLTPNATIRMIDTHTYEVSSVLAMTLGVNRLVGMDMLGDTLLVMDLHGNIHQTKFQTIEDH